MKVGWFDYPFQFFIQRLQLSILFFFNSLWGMLYNIFALNGTNQGSEAVKNSNVIAPVIEALPKYFAAINVPVKVMTIVGIAYIFVKFGMLIFNAYFVQDNRHAPDIVDITKRLAVSFIFILVIPYVSISSYYASSYLALSVGDAIADAQNPEDYSIYGKMKQAGISYYSVCYSEAIDEIDYDFPKNSLSSGINMLYDSTDENYSDIQEILDARKGNKSLAEMEADYKEVYDKTCGYNGGLDNNGLLITQVYDGFIANPETSKTMLLNNPDRDFDFTLWLFLRLVILIYEFCAIIVVIRRFLDILIINFFSFVSIGDSLANNSDRGMTQVLLKLLSCCLTQFFVIVEMQLFKSFTTNANFTAASSVGLTGLLRLVYVFAWLFLLLSTPVIMQNLTHDTGTKGMGMQVAKSLSHLR